MQRLKSVSVGSPQKLTLHREIKTDDAAFLEKYIHRLLDNHRAKNGEFFNVSAKELDRAIEEAEAFLADSLPVLQEVERHQKRQPTSRVLDPSEGIKALHSELREAERQAFFLGQKIVTLRGRIKIAIGESLGIRGIASWKWREQWRLDQDALRREEPKVYETFKCLSGYREFHLE